MKRVDAVRTPVSVELATSLIAKAFQDLYTQAPTNRTLAILLAQWGLETGQGKSLYNNNFGNITTPRGNWEYGWFLNPPSDELHQYRNYESPAHGAQDFIDLLKRLYPLAMAAAIEGDIEKFARLLKEHPIPGKGNRKRAYFEASLDRYLHGIKRADGTRVGGMRPLFKQYFRLLEAQRIGDPEEEKEPEASCSLLQMATVENLVMLRLGSKGPDVAYVQILTGTKGDGIFGPQTKLGVERFQTRHELTVDGVVGLQTWTALKAQLEGGHETES